MKARIIEPLHTFSNFAKTANNIRLCVFKPLRPHTLCVFKQLRPHGACVFKHFHIISQKVCSCRWGVALQMGPRGI